MVNGDAYNTFFFALYYQTFYFKKIFPNIFKHYRTISNIFLKTCLLFFSGCIGEESCGVGEGAEGSEAEGARN